VQVDAESYDFEDTCRIACGEEHEKESKVAVHGGEKKKNRRGARPAAAVKGVVGAYPTKIEKLREDRRPSIK